MRFRTRPGVRSPATLDVGGRVYRTARRTVERAGATSGMLGVLCGDAFADETDADGAVFVDRDGAPFVHVLPARRARARAPARPPPRAAALRWWPRAYPGVQPGGGQAVRRELRFYASDPVRTPAVNAAAALERLCLGVGAGAPAPGGRRYSVTDADFGSVRFYGAWPRPDARTVLRVRMHSVPADRYVSLRWEALDTEADRVCGVTVYVRTAMLISADHRAGDFVRLRAPTAPPLSAPGTTLTLSCDGSTGAVSLCCDDHDHGPVYTMPAVRRLLEPHFTVTAERGCVLDVLTQ